MRRRMFLRSGVASGCLVAMPRLLAEGNAPPVWKSAVGLNGFASSSRKYGIEYALPDVLQFAKDAGFQGVELVICALDRHRRHPA